MANEQPITKDRNETQQRRGTDAEYVVGLEGEPDKLIDMRFLLRDEIAENARQVGIFVGMIQDCADSGEVDFLIAHHLHIATAFFRHLRENVNALKMANNAAILLKQEAASVPRSKR